MAGPINPSKKRVVKKTDIKSSDKKSTSGTETKTVYRKDRVTPKKVVKTEYTNYYTPKGGMMGGSTIESKEKQKFDKSGKLKSTTTLTPIKKDGGAMKGYAVGGATEETCGPGRPKCGKTRTIRSGKTQRFKTGPAPGRTWMSSMAKGGSAENMCPPGGCGHKRAQRVNSRREAASKIPVGKIIGGIGAAVLGGLAYKNRDKIKEKLGIERNGGSIKKISKMQMGGDPTIARKCPKGKCGKVSVAPIGGGMQTTGSKIKSGLKKLFTQTHKAGPSRAKRIK